MIIGAGLTGATIARVLSDNGFRVLVLERRAQVGGNVHDCVHDCGVRFNTYGPHYFRTSSLKIWNFVTRFMPFTPYAACIASSVDGIVYDWPLHSSTITSLTGSQWYPAFTGAPTNFEEAALAMMPARVYNMFVAGYTEKQWGVKPTELSASLARRFDIRMTSDTRLSLFPYQGVPVQGYTAWVSNMLEGIPVYLNCDYFAERSVITARRGLVYTGSIDTLCDNIYGRLRYRGQRRLVTHLSTSPHLQSHIQINYPSLRSGPAIRKIEWNYLPYNTLAGATGVLTTEEFPCEATQEDEREYPFPDRDNSALYERYKQVTAGLRNITVCGRLGEYRYFDMDQAIGRALMISRRLLAGESC